MLIQHVGRENKFVFGGRIFEGFSLIIEDKNRYLPFNFQWFLFGIIEDQPTAKTPLAWLAGLIMNRLSPHCSNLIRNDRGSRFFPREFLVTLD